MKNLVSAEADRAMPRGAKFCGFFKRSGWTVPGRGSIYTPADGARAVRRWRRLRRDDGHLPPCWLGIAGCRCGRYTLRPFRPGNRPPGYPK